MQILKNKHRSRLVAAAMRSIPCDLTVENVQLVNVVTGEIYPAAVDVLDGVVVAVREEGDKNPQSSASTCDGGGMYLVPGFIDVHMHVESTMLLPRNLGEALLPQGTTTVFTDPHEIANVMGLEGVRFMVEDGAASPLRQYNFAPSCVPSVPGAEGAGASFGAAEMDQMLQMEGVIGIAEVMDFVGVCNDSPRMREIVGEGHRHNALIQGHAPQVSGKELAAYLVAGPSNDHASTAGWEVSEKLRAGMHVNLMGANPAAPLEQLLEGLSGKRYQDFVSISTDDVHVKDILDGGHVNAIVAKAIAAGTHPLDAIRWATLNAAREYGITDLGAVAPGYVADFQLVEALDGRTPHRVFVGGKLVAEKGKYLLPAPATPKSFPNTVNLPKALSEKDFFLPAPQGAGDTINTLILRARERGSSFYDGGYEPVPVREGAVFIEGRRDLQFACVFNRHGSGERTVALLRDFGLEQGAVASTVSHDCHNLAVVYRDPADALLAAKTLEESGGGVCAVAGGKVLALLPLPVAGLMSPLRCDRLVEEIDRVEAAIGQICPDEKNMLLRLALLALPVLPGLVLTDKGIVDGHNQQFQKQFSE